MIRHTRALQCLLLVFCGILCAFYLIVWSHFEMPFYLHGSSNKSDISPFPEFNLNASHFDIGDDFLRVYPEHGDLWNGDVNCTRYHVHLLKPGSHPQPGAFVSFPGSGNTWLRNLLMAITGVYITSVYSGDSDFRSEGRRTLYTRINNNLQTDLIIIFSQQHQLSDSYRLRLFATRKNARLCAGWTPSQAATNDDARALQRQRHPHYPRSVQSHKIL